MAKQCNRCLKWKDEICFYYHAETKDRLMGQCKDCRHEIQREYRKVSDNKSTKVYEKTHKGFLMRLYRNMQSRIKGIQKEKFYLYKGKELIGKDEFYSWAINNSDFLSLFMQYEKSGYQRKLAPSVDRINSKKGYELVNMEWVTMSENSRRGALNKRKIKSD